jgi:hypothetical protein
MSARRKIKATLTAVALVTAVSVPLTAAPAEAAKRTCPDGWCSNITHLSPDDGFDDPFGIHCWKYRSDGSSYVATDYIYEGSGGYANGCSDVIEVYVKSGTQIKCWHGSIFSGSFQIEWDSTGWHDTDPYPFSGQDHNDCVYQLD